MKAFVLLACVIIIISFSTAWVIGRSSPHLLSENCQSCHLATETINSDNAYLLLNAQEILCERCHANAIKSSHPSGIVTSKNLPEIFKLNWQSKLTCSTCHDIHSEAKGLMVTELTGKEFCHSCHEKSFFENMKDLGTSLFISGHTVAGSEHFSDQLDSFSLKCMECHINQTGNLNVSVVDGNAISHSGGRVSHPIGREYKKAAQYGGYRPIGLLDKRINLPDGKVSCISCHKAFDKKHGANIFEEHEQHKLCNSCHDI